MVYYWVHHIKTSAKNKAFAGGYLILEQKRGTMATWMCIPVYKWDFPG